MSDLFIPVDDNWGDGDSTVVSYPFLPDILKSPISVQGISKTVQKRHAKQAKEFERLLNTTIQLGDTAGKKRKKGATAGNREEDIKTAQDALQLKRQKVPKDSHGQVEPARAARVAEKEQQGAQGDLVQAAASESLAKGQRSSEGTKAKGEGKSDSLKTTAKAGKAKKKRAAEQPQLQPQRALAASLWGDTPAALDVKKAGQTPVACAAQLKNGSKEAVMAESGEAAVRVKSRKGKGLDTDTAGRPLPDTSSRQEDKGLGGAAARYVGGPNGQIGSLHAGERSKGSKNNESAMVLAGAPSGQIGSVHAGERSKGSKKRARQAAAKLRAQARAGTTSRATSQHDSVAEGPPDNALASPTQTAHKQQPGLAAAGKHVQQLEGSTVVTPASTSGLHKGGTAAEGEKRAKKRKLSGASLAKGSQAVPSSRPAAEVADPAQQGGGEASAKGASRGKPGRPAAEDTAPAQRAGGDSGAKGASKGKPGLMEQMAAKLQGSRFRWLNEQLYTTDGDEAFQLMQEQPQLFTQYHEGFRQQTQQWPSQPLDVAVKWLSTLPASLTVADFGCGDAELARRVKQRVHSLDLVASAPDVIACNMAETPLETGTVDVAIFCLALMGTDYPAFLAEASRVLKPEGRLWIAEVRSRFVPEAGSEDFSPFLGALKGLGFKLVRKDSSNKMFVVFELHKKGVAGKVAKVSWPELKPCLYKRR